MFWFERQKECKCCVALKDENIHLRGLVDRLMQFVAPPVVLEEQSDNPAKEEVPEGTTKIQFGD